MPSILIVEDEEGWQRAMQRNLLELFPSKPIELSADEAQALRQIRSRPWRLLSWDLRLPKGAGQEITIHAGLRLTQRLDVQRLLSKQVIYSATVSNEWARDKAHEAMWASALPPDKYAKGSGDPSTDAAWEALPVRQWAERVQQYLECPQRKLDHAPPGSPDQPYLSWIGHWLEKAPQVLPPLLAQHAQDLANQWEGPVAGRLTAAIRLTECVARLALAQTAVLLQARPEDHGSNFEVLPPQNEQHAEVLRALKNWAKQLQPGERCHWNWRGWLSDEALDALSEVHRLRNQTAHELSRMQAKQVWDKLLPHLHRVMDLCGYWALHPLCTDVRFSPTGYWAQCLASTAWPSSQRALEADFDVPPLALTHQGADAYWQSPAYRAPEEPWQLQGVSWRGWLEREFAGQDGAWLLMWRRPESLHGGKWLERRLNLVDGKEAVAKL